MPVYLPGSTEGLATANGELSLANAMGQLDAGDGDGRAVEGLEPRHRCAAPFDRSMILLNDVVQILAGSRPGKTCALSTALSRTHRLSTFWPIPRSRAACAAVTPRSLTSLIASSLNSRANTLRPIIHLVVHHRNDLTLEEVAVWLRPSITGWINYYGHFQRSALIPVFRPLDFFLMRWARRKYQRFQSAQKKTRRWLDRVQARQPLLFPHWVLEGRQNNRSRMNGDVHVRF